MPASPPVLLRALEERDAQFVVDLCTMAHCRPFVHPPTLEQVRSSLGNDDGATYIVESEKRNVGMVRLVFMGEPLWLCELRLIAISEPGRGFGRAALDWVAREVFEVRKAHRLYLEVASRNVHAQALYERCGYVREGVWRDGFRSEDGLYDDLIAFAMLDREYAARR